MNKTSIHEKSRPHSATRAQANQMSLTCARKKIRGYVVHDAAPTSDITQLLHILRESGSLTNLHVAVSTGYCNG